MAPSLSKKGKYTVLYFFVHNGRRASSHDNEKRSVTFNALAQLRVDILC